MGPPRLPEHLDRRVVLARDRARLVVLHARGHIRPPVPNIERRKLCSLQFPDDLLGRFHSGLDDSAAVPLLALGRISAAGASQRATAADPERVRSAAFCPLGRPCGRSAYPQVPPDGCTRANWRSQQETSARRHELSWRSPAFLSTVSYFAMGGGES